MTKAEGEGVPSQEITNDEKIQFKTRVGDLIAQARNKYTLKYSPDSPIQSSRYRIYGREIVLTAPNPDEVIDFASEFPNPHIVFVATVFKHMYTNEKRHVFTRSREISLNPDTLEMKYDERIIERDPTGQRIPTWMEQQFMDFIKEKPFEKAAKYIEEADSFYALVGAKEVTRDRYNHMMSVLKSLGPEHEVVEGQ